MLEEFLLKIRRRESPFYERLYQGAKALRSFEVPVIPLLHPFLYRERQARLTFLHFLTRSFYYSPLFKSQCRRVGRRLDLIGGIPLIMGHLCLELGDDVTIHGVSTFIGAKVFDNPTLTIGNNSHLGYMLMINVGRDVTIGNNVLIGARVTIMSYDGHPTNPAERHLPAPPESSRPVTICDNVWIGTSVIILKGVTIGEGSVVASGSVVTTKVPPNCLAIGNPARVFPLFLPETE
jgi:acetyltransferase-like isoleucine patch superfamily enzyme